jgi:hypothetical protein
VKEFEFILGYEVSSLYCDLFKIDPSTYNITFIRNISFPIE